MVLAANAENHPLPAKITKVRLWLQLGRLEKKGLTGRVCNRPLATTFVCKRRCVSSAVFLAEAVQALEEIGLWLALCWSCDLALAERDGPWGP